jgi:YgiT-type zinc finger domain-containing protein
MKCPVCKGNMKRGKTNFPVEIGEGLLFVKNVPSDICQQCGEVFIPDKIAASLEKIVSKAKQSKIELEVISYEKVA